MLEALNVRGVAALPRGCFPGLPGDDDGDVDGFRFSETCTRSSTAVPRRLPEARFH